MFALFLFYNSSVFNYLRDGAPVSYLSYNFFSRFLFASLQPNEKTSKHSFHYPGLMTLCATVLSVAQSNQPTRDGLMTYSNF